MRPPCRLAAPELVDLEVAAVLRRLVLTGEVDQARAEQALRDWRALPIRRYRHGLLLPRVWDLRDNLTAHDASYVALAEALEVPLLTCDGRLARSMGHDAVIEHVAAAAR